MELLFNLKLIIVTGYFLNKNLDYFDRLLYKVIPYNTARKFV